MFFKTTLLWSLGASALLLSAQVQVPPTLEKLPQRILMPWQIHGIDARSRGLMRENLTTIQTNLGKSLFSDSSNWRPEGTTINRGQLYGRMIAGNKNGDPFPGQSLAIQPVWCRFFNSDLIAVTATTTATGQNLGVGISIIPANAKTQFNQTGDANAYSNEVANAFNRAVADLQSRPQVTLQRDHSLQVEIASGNTLSRADESPAECLNLLLVREFSTKAPTLSPLGELNRFAAKDFLGPEKTKIKPLRATRKLITEWYPDPQSRTLPVAIKLKTRWHEAVLGNPLAKLVPMGEPTALTFAVSGSELSFQIPPALLQSLEGFRETLTHADLPQVSKVYGAWAYLDRGRAWGLKIGDRMVAQNVADSVEGHVVGFFGPHLGIKSPRGFPVAEGAILFIRKGQKKTANGMTFQFDPKAYPFP